jgi:hypothetical protein
MMKYETNNQISCLTSKLDSQDGQDVHPTRGLEFRLRSLNVQQISQSQAKN